MSLVTMTREAGVCQRESAGVPGEWHAVHVDCTATPSRRLISTSRRLRVPRERDGAVSVRVERRLRLVPQRHVRQHRPAQTQLRLRPRTQTTPAAVRHLIAKFHYTDPTRPARTFLRPGSPINSVGSVRVSDKVRAGPRGSGRVRVVEFSLYSLPWHYRCLPRHAMLACCVPAYFSKLVLKC